MPRLVRLLLLGLGIFVLVVAVVLFILYRASQRVPEFYQQALAADPQAQEKAGEQMERQAFELQNSVEKVGRWEAVFTAEQINGWLAVYQPRKHPDILPAALRDPRVEIEPDGITLAARAEQGAPVRGVVSLKVDVYLDAPNVVGLRIRNARLGSVPAPLEPVVQAIKQAAQQSEIQVRWLQADGDPVALITLPPLHERHKTIRIETVRLEAGRLHVAGTTRPRE